MARRKRCCKKCHHRGGRLDGSRLKKVSRFIKGHSGTIKKFAKHNRLASRGLSALSKKFNPGGLVSQGAALAAQRGYGYRRRRGRGWQLATM